MGLPGCICMPARPGGRSMKVDGCLRSCRLMEPAGRMDYDVDCILTKRVGRGSGFNSFIEA